MLKKSFEWLWLAALILTPFVLWLLPANVFDNTGVDICPSKLFFNIECFGCGMTRGIMHLHHLEVDDALYFNQMTVVVYPALIAVWFFWVYKSLSRLGYDVKSMVKIAN